MSLKRCKHGVPEGFGICEDCLDADRLTAANADLQQRLDAAEEALKVAQGTIDGHSETIGAWIHSFKLSEAKVAELEAEKDAAMQSVGGEETWRYWYRQFTDMKCDRDHKQSALTAANSRVEVLTVEVERLQSLVQHPGDGTCDHCGCAPARAFNICESCADESAREVVSANSRVERLREALGIISDTDPASIGDHDDVCETCCGMRETASEALADDAKEGM